MEQWKPVLGRPEYEVSDQGNVRKGLKPISTWAKRKKRGNYREAYMVVEFYQPYKRVYVHTVVLEAFIGPRPPGRQCRHLNGVSTDNRLENLKWGTARENTDDRISHNPRVYLSEAEVAAARALLVLPQMTLRKIAKILGCSKSTIGNISQTIS